MNGYELDTEKAIEIFSKVSKILREKYGDSALLSLGDISSCGLREGHYITCRKLNGTSQYSHMNELCNDKIDDFILKVDEMMKPAFIQVTKACVDIFDTEIFIDKEELVSVKSIVSKDDVLLTDGREIKIDRLYYKG